MIDGLVEFLAGIPPLWRVFFLSMLPVAEMRVAFPLGLVWGLEIWPAFLFSMLGNAVPIIPLLLVLKRLLAWLGTLACFARPLKRLTRYNERNQKMVRRYGVLGLAVLVAVPLPGTGVWSGCMAAALMDIPFMPALLAICGGGLIAGALVLMAVSGVLAVAELPYGLWVLAGIFLAGLIIYWLRRKKKRQK